MNFLQVLCILLIDKKKTRNKSKLLIYLLKFSSIIVDKYFDFFKNFTFKKVKKSYIGTSKKNE
ncbi:MAG: hypothetical protein RI980_1097 [Bacteroidota bacterium]|jgi:hypothetical protein|nr:MAG: hypothetical protein EAY77_04800 [Flavobacteriia bacterium]